MSHGSEDVSANSLSPQQAIPQQAIPQLLPYVGTQAPNLLFLESRTDEIRLDESIGQQLGFEPSCEFLRLVAAALNEEVRFISSAYLWCL